MEILQIKKELLGIPVGKSNDKIFLNSSKHYSLSIYNKENKLLQTIDNFYCHNVYTSKDKIILSGFQIKQNFFRIGTILFLDKTLQITEVRNIENYFSEILWSDGIVCCANTFKPEQSIMNGEILTVENFKKIKLPTMLLGEYEFRGGIKHLQEYYFYGVDKDNYRGVIVKLKNNKTEFIETEIKSELWQFSGIETYKNDIILAGNKWENVGFKGFIMVLTQDNSQKLFDIPITSSWFETVNIKRIHNKLLISVFDFDSNEGILFEFNSGEFKILEKTYNSNYFLSDESIFVKSN